MRVRANVQKQIELATGEIGMPTRSELEGVHQKLAETRRTLRMELNELKAEIAELKANRAAKPASVQPEVVKVAVDKDKAEVAEVEGPAKIAKPANSAQRNSGNLLSAAKALAKKSAVKTPAAKSAEAQSTSSRKK